MLRLEKVFDENMRIRYNYSSDFRPLQMSSDSVAEFAKIRGKRFFRNLATSATNHHLF